MLSNDASRATTPAFMPVVPGLHVLRDVFVNLYYAAAVPEQLLGPWVLIDAGLPGSAAKVKAHAAEVFGPANPPIAIVMTHAHFDHAGSLDELLKLWPEVAVYAHPLELPYLTGRSSYPPPDPTVGGGLMAWSSFLYPKHPYDLGARVHPLPEDGSVPGLPGWRWLHTPGHTPGHVSFFREEGRVLVAGDAFTTVRGESAIATYTQHQEVHGPPAYFTPDWDAARVSVAELVTLVPEVGATGHGIPMHGDTLRSELAHLAVHFNTLARPKIGRYAHQAAVADADGVRSVPPPLVSPLIKTLAIAGTVLAAVGLVLASKKRRKKPRRAWYHDRPARPRPYRH
ncbi:MBL fold metallo-hydrolase [Hymenobacter bucti]|uniref:MBL fold metallo-hydrolase n=1 Tax=Hymenobacter bucti TaxID=1844114 RepID=A0ABW4QPE5_9BACT